jgi:hypothetical protein
MQSTAAPLKRRAYHGKMAPKTKRKELGRTCMQAGESSLHRPLLIHFQLRPQHEQLQQPRPHKQGTQKPTSSIRPLKSRNRFPPKVLHHAQYLPKVQRCRRRRLQDLQQLWLGKIRLMLLRMASTSLIKMYTELPELSENVCPVIESKCGELLMGV